MRPSGQLRRRMIGILCAAHELYPLVNLHAFAVLSNHWEFLASCDCAEELALYIGYVNSNFARECGREHDWSGPFWARRVRMIPCLDDAATIERLRYCMAQGAKEGLVASPLDWPGASSVPALIGNMTLQGERIDRTGLRRAREAAVRAGKDGRDIVELDYATQTTLRLVALPSLFGLDQAALRARHVELLAAVIQSAESERNGRPVLGLDIILTQDPHAAPAQFVATDAPICHTSSATIRRGFRRLREALSKVYREVADSIKLMLSPRAQRQAAQAAAGAAANADVAVDTRLPPAWSQPRFASVDQLTPEASVTLTNLLKRVPSGMFGSNRFVAPASRTLLADLAFVRYVDG
jgi:hypothetical protein